MAYVLSRRKPDLTFPSVSGSICTFNSQYAGLPLKSHTVDIIAVQSGSGTPSPDNVRSISGWDNVNIACCGTNIWNEEWEVGSIAWGTGINQTSSDRIRSKGYIPVSPNTSYFINVPREGSSSYTQTNVFFYDKDKSFISALFINVNEVNRTFTTPNICRYLRFSPYDIYGTTYNNDISINYPSTDTDYHPYTGMTANIPFGSTIYGGALDVKTGLLTVDRGYYEFDGSSDENWSFDVTQSGINRFTIDNLDLKFTANTTSGISNLFENTTEGTYYQNDNVFYMRHIFGYNRIDVMCDSCADLNTFKSMISATPLQIVINHTTPTTIQLSPTEIQTILGQNTIYADTGDTTIQYIKLS